MMKLRKFRELLTRINRRVISWLRHVYVRCVCKRLSYGGGVLPDHNTRLSDEEANRRQFRNLGLDPEVYGG